MQTMAKLKPDGQSRYPGQPAAPRLPRKGHGNGHEFNQLAQNLKDALGTDDAERFEFIEGFQPGDTFLEVTTNGVNFEQRRSRTPWIWSGIPSLSKSRGM